MRDEDVSAEEAREAEALARALGGEPAGAAGPPRDAVEAAAMLRHADGELSDARQEAILAELLGELDDAGGARAPRVQRPPLAAEDRPFWGDFDLVSWLRWLVPAGAAAALGAVALLSLRSAPDATELPRPGLALLEAQGAALRGAGAGELDREMAGYRSQIYGALEGRYGGER